jgi:hypothetical protein
MIIVADETSKNDHTLARRYRRAPAGMRATTDAYDFNRHQGYSVGAAMSKDGYLAVKVIPGAFDSFDFFDFVAEQVVCISSLLGNQTHIDLQLPQMNEWPQKHSVLVLDNCRIHHNDALLELLSANSVSSFIYHSPLC